MFDAISKRLCKYTIKRVLGRYLDDDVDALDFSLDGSAITLRNVNLFGPMLHKAARTARVKLMTLKVPWRSFTSSSASVTYCQISLNGLFIELDGDPEVALAERDQPRDDDLCEPSLKEMVLASLTLGGVDGNAAEEPADGRIDGNILSVSTLFESFIGKTEVTVTNAELVVISGSLSLRLLIPSLFYHLENLMLPDGFMLNEFHPDFPDITIANCSGHCSAELNPDSLNLRISEIDVSIRPSLLITLADVMRHFSKSTLDQTVVSPPKAELSLVQSLSDDDLKRIQRSINEFQYDDFDFQSFHDVNFEVPDFAELPNQSWRQHVDVVVDKLNLNMHAIEACNHHGSFLMQLTGVAAMLSVSPDSRIQMLQFDDGNLYKVDSRGPHKMVSFPKVARVLTPVFLFQDEGFSLQMTQVDLTPDCIESALALISALNNSLKSCQHAPLKSADLNFTVDIVGVSVTYPICVLDGANYTVALKIPSLIKATAEPMPENSPEPRTGLVVTVSLPEIRCDLFVDGRFDSSLLHSCGDTRVMLTLPNRPLEQKIPTPPILPSRSASPYHVWEEDDGEPNLASIDTFRQCCHDCSRCNVAIACGVVNVTVSLALLAKIFSHPQLLNRSQIGAPMEPCFFTTTAVDISGLQVVLKANDQVKSLLIDAQQIEGYVANAGQRFTLYQLLVGKTTLLEQDDPDDNAAGLPIVVTASGNDSPAITSSILFTPERKQIAVLVQSLIFYVERPLVACFSRISGLNDSSFSSPSSIPISFSLNARDCAMDFTSSAQLETPPPRLLIVSDHICLRGSCDKTIVDLRGLSLHLLDGDRNTGDFVRFSIREVSPVSLPLTDHAGRNGYVTFSTVDTSDASILPGRVECAVGTVTVYSCSDTLAAAFTVGNLLSECLVQQSKPQGFATSATSLINITHYDLPTFIKASNETLRSAPLEPPQSVEDFDADLCLDLDSFSEDYTDGNVSVSGQLPNNIPEPEVRLFAGIDVVDDYIFKSTTPRLVVESKEHDPAVQPNLVTTVKIHQITWRFFAGVDFSNRHEPTSRSQHQHDDDDYDIFCSSVGLNQYVHHIRDDPRIITAGLPSSDNGYGRVHSDMLELRITGIAGHLQSYASDSTTCGSKHRLSITGKTLVINDCIPMSRYVRFMEAEPKSSSEFALVITCDALSSSIPEHRVSLRVAPLRFKIDASVVRFLIAFGAASAGLIDTITATAVEDDVVQLNACQDPVAYVHFFECASTSVTIDYWPSNVDGGDVLKNGEILRLLQLFPLRDVRFDLDRIELRGVSGYARVMSTAFEIWAESIARYQFQKYIGGIVPFRSVVQFGCGMRDLMFVPYHYLDRRDGLPSPVHTARAAKQVTVETLSLAMLIVSGAQRVLEGVDSIWPQCNDARRHRASRPHSFHDGLRQAHASLALGLRQVSHNIVGIPLQHWRERDGPIATVSSLVRGIPRAVLQPTIATARAVKLTLHGLRSTIAPKHR